MERALRYAAVIYVIGLAVHTADHVHRGLRAVTGEVFWAGNLSTALGLVMVVLIFMRHRLAPLAATWIALPLAVGVASVHLLPHWGVLSDPFPGGGPNGVTAVSWIAVVTEIAGAAALAVIGIAMMRRMLERRPALAS